ncbi:MAG: DUF2334 domain-containing protein [Aquabacterium sp.]|nr:DUF2334 domain-containing protein [Aquabacterium sp.]
MSFFCVRDDDASYFTSPADLELAWGWWPHVLTLGVIPFSVETRYLPLPGRDHALHQLGEAEFAVSGNDPLCEHLRKHPDKYALAMHGCTHRYKLHGDRLKAEYDSSDAAFLGRETRRGLEELQRCFGHTPKVFIPPDNAISRKGLEVVHGTGFSYVQTPFPLKPDSVRWFLDYAGALHSWGGRLRHRLRHKAVDLRVCGSISKGIGAAILVKFDDETLLRERLDLAVAQRWPITLATHYWEMADASYRRKFASLTDDLMGKGLKPASMETLYCAKDS